MFFALVPALLSKDEASGRTVTITYVEADGSEQEVQAEIGQNLLDVAHDNNVELEGKHMVSIERWTYCLSILIRSGVKLL